MSVNTCVIGARTNRTTDCVIYLTRCNKCEYRGKSVKDDIDTSDVIYWKSASQYTVLDSSTMVNGDTNNNSVICSNGDTDTINSNTIVVNDGITYASI